MPVERGSTIGEIRPERKELRLEIARAQPEGESATTQLVEGGDGLWRLPELRKEFSAPHAALHLGPIHIVFDITAHELAADVAGTEEIQVENWFVMFVKPGLIGPFRAEGRPVETADGRINVDLTLYDEGRDDRVITTGSAVFHRR